MSKVIELIEKLGQDSTLEVSEASLKEMSEVFELSSEEEQALILGSDELEKIMQTNPNIMAVFFPAEDDDSEGDDSEGDDSEGDDSDEQGENEESKLQYLHIA